VDQAKPRHLAPGTQTPCGLDGLAGSPKTVSATPLSEKLGAQGVGVGLALGTAAAGV
jgi:hypothetical protein